MERIAGEERLVFQFRGGIFREVSDMLSYMEGHLHLLNMDTPKLCAAVERGGQADLLHDHLDYMGKLYNRIEELRAADEEEQRAAFIAYLSDESP